jgi:hypothetical protein
MRRLRSLAYLLALLVGLAAMARAEEQTLVLKDGRKIQVTTLFRRNGAVLFETTKGERFSVSEDQVVAPPLASIPNAPATGATSGGQQILVLKDGRKIPVRRMARKGGQVRFETLKGESFSVPETDVVSPSLESIQSAEAPAATPAPPAATEAPTAVAAATPTPPKVAAAYATPKIFEDGDYKPLPNRWSIAYPQDPRFAEGSVFDRGPGEKHGSVFDPYNQNTLKGDKPIIGNSTFFVMTGDLTVPSEFRRVPVGSGVSTANPAELEFFGNGKNGFTTPRATLSLELFGGDTAFKPKTWSLKATGVYNLNYVINGETNQVDVDVREGKTRLRTDLALQEAFGELRLLTVDPYFDFVSARVGIQPFVSDFRGFIFSDDNLGARLFGNAGNNRWQYNAAYFDLLEKQTNSELNLFEKRDQRVFIANVFKQDFITPGYTISASYHQSTDDPTVHYDANGFLVRPAKIGVVRPHEIDSKYIGFAGDGHFGRLNVSHAFYYAFGTDKDYPLTGKPLDIRAQLAAVELSIDKDWLRLRTAGFYASGDGNPGDGTGKGFDTIYDDSNFAGGEFSFWSRAGIPLTGTGVLLKTPGSLLPDLRSNKFEGQANFVNPGLWLVNGSLEAALTPKLKFIANVNYLSFAQVEPLQLLVFQQNISKEIGVDMGGGFEYRPALNQNIIITAGATQLLTGSGFKDIYRSICSVPGCGNETNNRLFNVFLNLKLTY